MSILCKPAYVNTFQDENKRKKSLDKSAIVLTAYGGTDIEVLGSVTAKITVRGHTSSVKFIITDTLSPNILSYKDSMNLQLVHRINSLSLLHKTVIIIIITYSSIALISSSIRTCSVRCIHGNVFNKVVTRTCK